MVQWRIARALGATGGLIALVGCSNPGFFGGDAPAAAKTTPAVTDTESGAATAPDEWAHVAVPPENGPRLAPITLKSPIYAKPDRTSAALGYLRVGARVARSEQPVTRRDCPEGWYAVRPLGFVCAGVDATVDLEHPVAKAIQVEPDRRRPMPYKYGFVRSVAPNYMRVPTKEEQLQYEMRLERHLRSYGRLRAKWDALDVGANDVPLDERGQALGAIPDHAVPMDESVRFGGDGTDAVPWWLASERKIPNLASFKVPAYAVIASRVKRHAGIAFIGTFVAGDAALGRRFAISTDARLVPADKIKADSGSPFHGYDITRVGLPVAFGYKVGATYWRLQGGQLERGEPLRWREFVPLSGTVKMIQGARMVETRDGRWLKSDELKVIAKSSKPPSWARGKTRWIDIGIVSQSMVLWEGDRPLYATLVSTGRDGLGEPGKTLSTPRGAFYVYQKHVTTTMDSDVADHEFELRDVPWVQYFKGGYALHAAYWHDDFGKVRSHGCINLAPIDARIAFEFSTPRVPPHWHAQYTADVTEPGTLIHVHP